MPREREKGMPKYCYRRKESPHIWYKFTIKHPDGRKETFCKSTETADKKLAESIVGGARADALRGKFQTVASKITLGELKNRYLEACAAQPSHESKGFFFAALFSFPQFAPERQANAVTREDCKKYQVWRLQFAKPASINKELGTFRNMYNVAIEDMGLSLQNPVTDLKFFSEKKFRRDRYLSPEEKKALFNDIFFPQYWKDVCLFALRTGARQGEIRNLKWDDIDFERGLIRILAGEEDETRYVPMHILVRDVLKRHEANKKGPYVFCNDDGTQLPRQGAIITALEKACLRNNIENFHFHDLRHTFASDFREAGGDLWTLKRYLGHKNIRMTERYAHITPKKAQLDDAMISYLGAIPGYQSTPNSPKQVTRKLQRPKLHGK